MKIRKILILSSILSFFIAWPNPSSLGQLFESRKACSIFDWKSIPHNQWTKLQTCNNPPRKVFHGASAIAPDRRTVFFFGADTHEKDYDNSVYRLHLSDLRWSRDYEADSVEDYRLTGEGYPVTSTSRPWAMHTFDGWDYSPTLGTLVLVGSPKHASRGIQQIKDPTVRSQPPRPVTWHYDPDTRSWELIQTRTPDLFARGFAWDPLRNRFVGHDGYYTYHYDPKHREWITYLASSVPGHHLRLVYDTFANRFLSLGNNHGSGELWSYTSESVLWKRIMPAQTPLPANGAAMAYDSHHQILLYLANDSPHLYKNPSGKSVTFLYQSQEHRWKRLQIKSPPLYGMNFLMQYDPGSEVFLHFEKSSLSTEQTTIWALRYFPHE